MPEDTPSPNGFFTLFTWITLLFILTLVLLLNFDIVSKVFRLLTNRTFLIDLGSLLIIIGIVSLIAGGVGILASKLIQCNEWLANSTQRLLRLGMWLPFFVLWGLPIWRSGKKNYWELEVWLEAITLGVAAAGPTIFLGACYYHLASRNAPPLANRRDRFNVLRPIFHLALLISILWQLYFVTAWPWKWANTEFYIVAAWAAAVIITGIELLMNLITGWWPGRDSKSPPAVLTRESRLGDTRSLMGAAGITMVGLIVWQLCSNFFNEVVTPAEASRAVYTLLVTGTAKVMLGANTIWNDVQVSFLEMIAGFAVAALIVLLVSEVFSRTSSLKPALGVLSLISVAPIVLASRGIFWVGIGFWQKALTIVCFVFFPLLQALWSYRTTRVLPRLLIAIDEALPYAFLGMVFGEAYAATAGLGILILVAGAKLFAAEQIATSFITFAFLAVISTVMRLFVKRLISVDKEAVPAINNE
jgi:ABC-type nitrate/sulfonate/bicarbonate transport system permease component